MKGRVVVLDALGGQPAAALVVDGRVEDLVIDPGTPLAPGAILRGKIERVTKGGAFVGLPGGRGFLRGGAQREGRNVIVQVTGHAEAEKAVPLTTRLIFKGRTVIVTPGASGINVSRQIRRDEDRLRLLNAADTARAAASDHGLIVRSQAATAPDGEIAEEADALLDLADRVLEAEAGPPEILHPAPSAHALAHREWQTGQDVHCVSTPGGFAREGVLEALDSLFRQGGAGSMIVEPTRALVAVDVNTGGDFSPAAGLKTNLAVARDLPRQLRLRGLGGQIVVDFAPMPKKDRRTLEEALKKAFRADPVETALIGWTAMGLFEMQRKRERRPLAEIWPP